MTRLLITRREFKSDEEKSSWKSYVKYPGVVLMVKKPEVQNYSACMVATDLVYLFSFLMTVPSKVHNRDVIPSYYLNISL